MPLPQRLRDNLKQALREGDKTRVSIIRLLLAEISNAEIAQGTSTDDAKVLSIIAREVKRHRESIEAFSRGNRQDLVLKEEAELAILLEYLPQQMSPEEIITAAQQVIEQVEARGLADKDKVMSKLMPQLKGKAEGKEVSTIVSQLLAGSSGS